MSRMAGDKINNLQRRMGDEEYKRVSQDGLQGGITTPGLGGSGQNKYSAAEVKAEFRDNGRTVDKGPDSNVNYFQGLVDSGDNKFNGKATAFLKSHGVTFPTKVKPEPGDPGTTEPGPPGVGGGETTGDNSPVQTSTGNKSPNINTGGGDSNINYGSGTIDNSVDNSRYYEGSDRSFTYGGGGSGDRYEDTPVSMATMAGYYDVDDSPSATAKFLDKYMDNNNLYQKGQREAYDDRTDTDYKASADSVNQFNPLAMQERLDREPQIDRDRSYLGLSKIFGDLDKFNLDWTPSKQPDDIESDVGDIAGDYMNKIS